MKQGQMLEFSGRKDQKGPTYLGIKISKMWTASTWRSYLLAVKGPHSGPNRT